jgi:hypothetical protein
LATKFTNGSAPNANRLVTGNSRKAMIASVEASLKRLKTDRIDIYWAHHPDSITPIEEMVRGFEFGPCRQDSVCRFVELPGLAAFPGSHLRRINARRSHCSGSSLNIAWYIASQRQIYSRHHWRWAWGL